MTLSFTDSLSSDCLLLLRFSILVPLSFVYHIVTMCLPAVVNSSSSHYLCTVYNRNLSYVIWLLWIQAVCCVLSPLESWIKGLFCDPVIFFKGKYSLWLYVEHPATMNLLYYLQLTLQIYVNFMGEELQHNFIFIRVFFYYSFDPSRGEEPMINDFESNSLVYG